MANKTIDMSKIRLLLRLHAQGYGKKTISAQTGIARNTVKKYLLRFVSLKITLDYIHKLNDHELEQLFADKDKEEVAVSERYATLQALLPYMEKQLKRKGITRLSLWEQYRQQHPAGYSRSQFGHHLQEYLGRSQPVMHMEHKAGDKLFIDFAGDKLQVTDAQTGEVRDVEVFVAILGCSQLTYVEAVQSQKKEDLIKVCEHTLQYIGGTTAAIVPDNLKSAVTRSNRYEPKINEAFASFAEHYNVVILPARAYRPKDKALVEGAVKLIYRSIYPKVTEQVYTSVADLNTAIWSALEEHNNAAFKGRDYSRRQQFEELERAALCALPAYRYEIKQQAVVTVMKNGHICLRADKHYYSVPYKYIGKRVKILYTSAQIEVYLSYECIAVHKRDMRKYQYTTLPDHLASAHRYKSDWSAEWFISQATKISPEVADYITRVIERKQHPEQAYKSCSGILSLVRKGGPERLTRACRRAAGYDNYSYRIIEDILTRNLDQDDTEEPSGYMPEHYNIRGSSYYQ
jgi:transposase